MAEKLTTPEKNEDVLNAEPEEIILRLYDLGIQKAIAKDKHGVQTVLKELIKSLNFDHKDMAGSFYDLYDYAMGASRDGKFEEVLSILQGLRSAWEKLVANEKISETISYEG